MGKTLTEKIFSLNLGKEVKVGKIYDIEPDLYMAHDGVLDQVVDDFRRISKGDIKNKDKFILVFDHFSPPSSEKWASIQKKSRDFAKEYDIPIHQYDGICHQILAEDPRVSPGKIALGADSHSVNIGAYGCLATGIVAKALLKLMVTGKTHLRVPESYKITFKGEFPEYISGKDIALKLGSQLGENGAIWKALEYHDVTDNKIPIDSRLTISNMSVEWGAMAGIFEPDDITKNSVEKKGGNYNHICADENSLYERFIEIDVSDVEPLVALPHSPANVKPVSYVEGKDIDQAFIGSCTGGKLEDIEMAAKILDGRKVNSYTRLIVTPASKKIYLEALRRGYIETLLGCGATVTNPGCGACVGIDKGILTDGEDCISTTNRNFKGRMGSPKSYVYLASAATAAASAIEGKITDPRKYL